MNPTLDPLTRVYPARVKWDFDHEFIRAFGKDFSTFWEEFRILKDEIIQRCINSPQRDVIMPVYSPVTVMAAYILSTPDYAFKVTWMNGAVRFELR